jgi:hypothetical protein
VDVYDPWIRQEEVNCEYGIKVLNKLPDIGLYSAII